LSTQPSIKRKRTTFRMIDRHAVKARYSRRSYGRRFIIDRSNRHVATGHAMANGSDVEKMAGYNRVVFSRPSAISVFARLRP
jgi:hypothetical protein